MEFSNLYFLYIWLPLLMMVYFLTREMRWKNLILLGFSLMLYAMGQPLYLPLLLGLTYVNYRLAKRIRRNRPQSVILPVAIDIAVLACFKYLDFFLDIFGISVSGGVLLKAVKCLVSSLNSIGFAFREPDSVLPIGISFYTFSMISYLMDVYRKKVAPAQRFSKLLLYVCLFPKLLQGPIVRYEQLDFQLSHRRTNPRFVYEGCLRFVIGLSKKVLLADYCGKVISELAAVGTNSTFVGSWMCAVLFMFRIYFDFSGYSDMAIGLGRIFGFTFCENFDLPYMSRSITEFWRRWHISLGTFFRDYLYIPLGGNRRGFRRQILNLLAVWFLTGLWHGASWNYVLWGLYFFGLLTAEKHNADHLKKLPVPGRRALTLGLILFGWVLFAHEEPSALAAAVGGMVGFGGFAGPGVGLKLLNSLPLLAACTVGCTSLPRRISGGWRALCGMTADDSDTITPRKAAYLVSSLAVMALLLWLCTVSLVGSTSAPSIYGNY